MHGAPIPRSTPREPLRFFDWLLLGFLLTAGILQLWRGWTPTLRGEPMTHEAYWRIAIGTFSLLLSGQVFLRTPAARLSISLLFLMQVIAFVKQFAWSEPERWMDASRAFRVQRLAELGFFAIAMVLVHLRPRRRASIIS